jgi:hypothetical protein
VKIKLRLFVNIILEKMSGIERGYVSLANYELSDIEIEIPNEFLNILKVAKNTYLRIEVKGTQEICKEALEAERK